MYLDDDYEFLVGVSALLLLGLFTYITYYSYGVLFNGTYDISITIDMFKILFLWIIFIITHIVWFVLIVVLIAYLSWFIVIRQLVQNKIDDMKDTLDYETKVINRHIKGLYTRHYNLKRSSKDEKTKK